MPTLLLALLAITSAPDRIAASPLLGPDHWAVRAAERLEAMGLVDDYLPAQRAVPLLVVRRALRDAERRAREAHLEAADLASTWRARLDAEWSGAERDGDGARVLGGEVGGGYEDGGTSPGAPVAGSPWFPPGGRSMALASPRPGPFLEGRAAIALEPHLALGAGVKAGAAGTDSASTTGELIVAGGAWALSVGRGPIAYGPGGVGAIVASGAVIDRVELLSTRPPRLPGFLAGAGDLAVDAAAARLAEPRHPYDPLLWEFSVQLRPHPRLTLAFIHGYMFGGAPWSHISAGDAVVGLLDAGNAPLAGNNVTSVAARWRLPTDTWLPLTARVEWGTDDEPGAAVAWPGLVAGLTAPMLPILNASLGVEVAYFGKGFLKAHDPVAWYAHSPYVGGWATGDTPLGDPLGGNGRAIRLLAAAEPGGGSVRLSSVAWLQDRVEDNPYTVGGAGGLAAGGSVEAEARLGRGALGVKGALERGRDGWWRREATVTARVFL